MSEITNGKRRFLSDEYIPLYSCNEPEPVLNIALDKCNFPNCNCEPEVCESMPYVEKE